MLFSKFLSALRRNLNLESKLIRRHLEMRKLCSMRITMAQEATANDGYFVIP